MRRSLNFVVPIWHLADVNNFIASKSASNFSLVTFPCYPIRQIQDGGRWTDWNDILAGRLASSEMSKALHCLASLMAENNAAVQLC